MGGELRVVRAGPGETIQDAGRIGYLRYGVTAAGPMDWLAYETANRALDNSEGAAAIEISVAGIELACEGAPLRVAFAGGAFAWTRNGTRLPAAAVIELAPGDLLAAKAGAWGAWCYLALEGGIDTPLALGSRSTHTRSRLGGLGGRALAPGDRLGALPVATVAARRTGAIAAPWLARASAPVRVVLGPQDDYFTCDAVAALFGAPFHLSPRLDRMAYWLNGPCLRHKAGHDIVSDGIVLGAIQVPGDGQPVVLMADRQPTGGYPKLGTVIRRDIGALAQRRPGEEIRFAPCEAAEARQLLLSALESLATPLVADAGAAQVPDCELLLSGNLISGVLDAVNWDSEG